MVDSSARPYVSKRSRLVVASNLGHRAFLNGLRSYFTRFDETGRRPNRPPIAGSGRLLFPTSGAAGGARFVYTAATILYTHYTASTKYLPLMSSQFDWH